ncbi:cupin domain-containing protein [Methanosarcina sp. MSH10X1]|uniref:cupin domain-containing protein n=1 Tax=Methanosarcina sp. MSH10X1 TaxID=2507075 RepID=UPI000FFCC0A4|nr:cupin domain-containing protein [Methanosarcina sp. MSH10X1]RXA20454.1 cupin domain-containing protein [Methanosarcina sp. MSH10X1]
MSGNTSKAIRDFIPEILKLSGREFIIRELSDSSFLPELESKLDEEVGEYLASKELEELADLLEVIYRIAELRGSSKAELETVRQQKKRDRGGFEKNLILFNPRKENFSQEVRLAASTELIRVVFKPEDAAIIEKHGVKMRIYTTKAESRNAAVLYQETQKGHTEEFLHEKSDFIYYILEGSGVWTIDDREYEARAGDVVVVPAGKRFWFRGNLKQICITAPAWEEDYEHHIKDIEIT